MKKYLTESIDLLSLIKGQKITEMVRLFCGDEDRFLADFPKVRKCELFASSGFSFFIKFELLGWIEFSEQEREISLVVEKISELPKLTVNENPEIEKIARKKYIDCFDNLHSESFWNKFIGTKVVDVNIIELRHDNENIRKFKNERGLLIEVDGGMSFVIQTSLAKNDTPGGINLIRRDQVRSDLETRLVFKNCA